MTTPTPDANGNIPPGYYQAEGDPPGLVRQWDGTQWVGGPIPPPPSTAATAPGIGLPATNAASIGVRIGAVLIDGLILFILIIAFTIPFAETESLNLYLKVGEGVGFLTLFAKYRAKPHPHLVRSALQP